MLTQKWAVLFFKYSIPFYCYVVVVLNRAFPKTYIIAVAPKGKLMVQNQRFCALLFQYLILNKNTIHMIFTFVMYLELLLNDTTYIIYHNTKCKILLICRRGYFLLKLPKQ